MCAVFPFSYRNFVTPIIESVRTPARITPYPTGRPFWGGAIPGTSCQATIALSRDILQQALARMNQKSKVQESQRSAYRLFGAGEEPGLISNRLIGRILVRI